MQFGQNFDYPLIKVEIDRERAGEAGVNVAETASAMIAATSSSRYIFPVYWADPKTGIGYQVQLQVPPAKMNSIAEVGMTPVKQPQYEGGAAPLLRDLAKITESTIPQEYDRINQRRIVTITANVVGEDLGRAVTKIEAAIKRAEDAIKADDPPPCVKDRNDREWYKRVKVGDDNGHIRGQVPAMRQMFSGLTSGLGLAVVVVFLMLTAYFQSFKLAFVSVATAPAVVAGVAFALFITHTTLNIQSFMGAIMAVGVAVANAILLVTFAENARQTGLTAADGARKGAEERLRPILMTSCAMIAGMVPMALGLGEGGEQSAPLGRAVIGGLTVATGATLLILPAVFSIIMGLDGRILAKLGRELGSLGWPVLFLVGWPLRSIGWAWGSNEIGSPSLHPDDPESSKYAPESADSAGHEHVSAHSSVAEAPPQTGLRGGTPPPP